MLTVRSNFVLASATLLMIFCVMNRVESLALLSLSVIIWVWVEWTLFQRLRLTGKPLVENAVRTIDGQDYENVTMVAERSFKISISGSLSKLTRGYRILVHDSVPDTFAVEAGQAYRLFDSGRLSRFGIDYSVSTSICGKASFPGLKVEVSDYWGFFRTEQFIAVNQEPTVLPFLIRPQTTVSVLKHNNLQRHIGHHRNKTAGVSSELLGIRDYRVGDPPRTIAWKPTARLGKLMTCEFENEVPIRATIIADLAAYQFQGRPGPSTADRAIMASAAIAKLLLADRDPVAAVIMRSESMNRIDHGSGERQLTRLLQHLLVASNPNPPLEQLTTQELVQLVYDNASRRFPQLFNETFNSGPAARRTLRLKPTRYDRIRRSLAIVLEHLLKLPAGMSTRLQFDNPEMRAACLQYVHQFSVVSSSTNVTLAPPWTEPRYWNQECRRMTLMLTNVMAEAKSRAKDNELFVIVAPEPIDQPCEDALESVIKTIIAAGHRVMFVAPLAPLPAPSAVDPVAERIMRDFGSIEPSNAPTSFGRRVIELGAAFARVNDPSLMQMVAMEIGILQSGKSRGRAMRARR